MKLTNYALRPIPAITTNADYEMTATAKNNLSYQLDKAGLKRGIFYDIRQVRSGGVTTSTATRRFKVNAKHPITGRARNLLVKEVIDLQPLCRGII